MEQPSLIAPLKVLWLPFSRSGDSDAAPLRFLHRFSIRSGCSRLWPLLCQPGSTALSFAPLSCICRAAFPTVVVTTWYGGDNLNTR
jgi:hypothetical protein